jgi:hypothetical protein
MRLGHFEVNANLCTVRRCKLNEHEILGDSVDVVELRVEPASRKQVPSQLRVETNQNRMATSLEIAENGLAEEKLTRG